MFRNYDDSYLGFSFTCIKINQEHPICIIYLYVVTADSIIPNNLKYYIEIIHFPFTNKIR